MVGSSRYTVRVSPDPLSSYKSAKMDQQEKSDSIEAAQDYSMGKFTSINFDGQDSGSKTTCIKSPSIEKLQTSQTVSRTRTRKARRSAIQGLIRRLLLNKLFLLFLHILYLTVPTQAIHSMKPKSQVQVASSLQPDPISLRITPTSRQDLADDWAQRIVPVAHRSLATSEPSLASSRKHVDRRILSDLVVNHGQRLLKSIAGSVENGSMSKEQLYRGVLSTPKPTSRLYDLLFPSLSHFSQASGNNLYMQPNSTEPIDGFNQGAPALVALSKSKVLSSSDKLVVPLNLSAPYESRTRTWLTSRLTGRRQRSGGRAILGAADGGDHEDKLSEHEHGDISSDSAINWPTSAADEPNTDHSVELEGDERDQGGEVTEMEPESASQPGPTQAELGGQDSSGSSSDLSDGANLINEEQTAEDPSEVSQSLPDLVSKGRHMSSMSVDEQKSVANPPSIYEDATGPLDESIGDQNLVEQSVELASDRSKNSPIIEGGEQFPMDGSYPSTDDGNPMRLKMASMSAGSDHTSSLSLSGNDSFLTAQLPTKYDTSLEHLPPEGYYDDYFKPDVSSSAVHQLQVSSDDSSPFGAGSGQNMSLLDGGSFGSSYDYTRQFYMNQQPLKQQHSKSDSTIEFIASNKTLSPGGSFSMLPSAFDEPTNGDSQNQYLKSMGSFELASPAHQGPQSLTENTTNAPMIKQNTSSTHRHNSGELQPVRMIIADTYSNTIDPKSQEKIINYTNESNRNTLKPQMKPEENFVNVDMNETSPPPLDEQVDQVAIARTQSIREPEEDEMTSTPSNFIVQPAIKPERMEQSGKSYQQDRGDEARSSHDLDDQQADRVHAMLNDINRMTSNARLDAASDTKRSSNKDRRVNQSVRVPGERVNQKPRDTSTKLVKQQTLRRPQVTEAKFNPKDLVLNPPTPQPILTTASTISSIVDLPKKMKKMKENQPDKNELMNELLTALDRVKVAIYKLQPLTAKMNAIYRKSVTSNTRDIIMDNHKGTYAKRYPPGDYDDTYDRMHPTDQASKHWSESRSRQRREADLPLTVQESIEVPTYASASGSNVSLSSPSIYKPVDSNSAAKEALSLGETQIVATGIGWRSRDGNLTKELEVTSELVRDKSDDDGARRDDSEKVLLARLGDDWPPAPLSVQKSIDSHQDESAASPLFGYRITIFQSADGDEQESDGDPSLVYEFNNRQETDEEDTMATSESSVSEAPNIDSVDRIGSRAPADGITVSESKDDEGTKESLDEPASSESKGVKSEKKKLEEGQGKKKAGKEKEKENKSKSKKSQSKKKNDEEEIKRKKEYKKIKHNKGVVSKEKKTMHRDKHIKAHDRGAAKEKALKERTQIEFFEREQIVDDEYDKAKKSVAKASWQTGHESKKMSKDSGDTMPSGGSHFVKHEAKEGHAKGVEASMGKQSNKFEKKQMEAKGKIFKGWREKGYKIITETEFIDRGSLHDSAYKKRDKGAAHHQKYKKHEDNSEGHHGSEMEHKKKSHKKEEKKSKMDEKKGKESKKEEKEEEEKKKKKKLKKKMKKKGGDHEHEESIVAPTVEPFRLHLATKELQRPEVQLDQESSHPKSFRHQFEPTRPMIRKQHQSSPEKVAKQKGSPVRLLNIIQSDKSPSRRASKQPVVAEMKDHWNLTIPIPVNHSQSSDGLDGNSSSFTFTGTLFGADSNRRSDQTAQSGTNSSLPKLYNSIRGLSSILPSFERNTILDIVDNSTGRHMNKTRIGTYDFTEDTGPISQTNSGPSSNISASVGSSILGKNIAKILSLASYQQANPDRGQARVPVATRSSAAAIPLQSIENLTTGKPLQVHKGRQVRPQPATNRPTFDAYPNSLHYPTSLPHPALDESRNSQRLSNLINILPNLATNQRPGDPMSPASLLEDPGKSVAPPAQMLTLLQQANGLVSGNSNNQQAYLANKKLAHISPKAGASDTGTAYLAPTMNSFMAAVSPPSFSAGQDRQLGFMNSPALSMAFPFMDYEQDSSGLLPAASRNFYMDRSNSI